MSDLDSQKLVLFFVPNYDGSNAADSTGSPLSYVRLGSFKESDSLATAAKRGDDLLESAGLSETSSSGFFVDDKRGEACDEKADDEESPYAGHTHYDHAHEAEECLVAEAGELETTYFRSTAKDVFTTTKSKAELTAEVLGEDASGIDPRGGWRDHTDGNRIVTVRGDRVDVVVGNYKRVVFGRVSGDHVGASSYEASGGHLFERTSTGAVEVYAIEHVEETVDGSSRWKVVERAHQADHVERWSGVRSEYFNGPVLKTTIGVDEESTTQNPEIEIEHHVGHRKSHFTADSVTRTLEVGELVDETDASGASVSETIVATSYERTVGKSSQRNFTFKEELWASQAIGIEGFVANFDLSAGLASFDDEISEVKLRAGVRIESQIGPRFEWHYGSDTRVCFAPIIRQTVGAALDVDVGFYGQSSLLYYKYTPDEGAYRIGDLEVSYVRKEDSVAESRALALLVHL